MVGRSKESVLVKKHRVLSLASEAPSPFESAAIAAVFDALSSLLEPESSYQVIEQPLSSTVLLAPADTVLVHGRFDSSLCTPVEVQRQLRAAHARGVRICAFGGAVSVLASCGLLEGRTASVHWSQAAEFAACFPNVKLDPQTLFLDDGSVATCAGGVASLDYLLHWIRGEHGVRVANQVANALLMPPHREGTQRQTLPRHVLPKTATRIRTLMDWVRSHIGEPHSLESMAHRMSVSPRTLQRAFVADCGLAPYEWLLAERVAYACDLLESPAVPMIEIALTVGFGSEETLRKHFHRVRGQSPSQYRKLFLAARQDREGDRQPPRSRPGHGDGQPTPDAPPAQSPCFNQCFIS